MQSNKFSNKKSNVKVIVMSEIPTNAHVILHLGLGSFHRAHQAVYLHHLHMQGDQQWVLAGGNIRNDMPETMAALAAQHGAYTLETVTPAGVRSYERITAIRQIIAYDEQLQGLINCGADKQTRIISFTVTEAGYYLDPDHRVDPKFADLASDLNQGTKLTIYGALTAILKVRMQKNAGPVTLMNCDNLRSNGERFRHGFLDFLSRLGDTALLEWVKANTTSPNAMVDRITPRPLPDIAPRVKAATGVEDACPVMGEQFIQWVIEDEFAAGRPAWEKVGAEMVDSVLPYEEAKIRILNASHSCIAWAGTLLGYHYIHEGVVNADIRQMAHDYVSEDVIPCLTPSPLNLANYRDVVLDRFSNPHLADTNQRVAMDGFSKIPGFIVPTLRERIQAGASMLKTAKIPALFLAFLELWHKGLLKTEYQDQGMNPTSAHAFFTSGVDPVLKFSQDPVLWGELAGHPALLSALQAATQEVQQFIKSNHHV